MFNANRRRRRYPAAFTLVELMLVIMIVGILSALVVVNSGTNVIEELQGAADIVTGEIAFARSLAVSNNDTYRMTFDTSGNKFTLTYTGTTTALATLPMLPFRTSLDTTTSHVVAFASLPNMGNKASLLGVVKMSNPAVTTTTLEFGGLGETTSTDATVIWLKARNSTGPLYISITVNPVSGLPSIGVPTSVAPSILTATGNTSGSSGSGVTSGS